MSLPTLSVYHSLSLQSIHSIALSSSLIFNFLLSLGIFPSDMRSKLNSFRNWYCIADKDNNAFLFLYYPKFMDGLSLEGQR